MPDIHSSNQFERIAETDLSLKDDSYSYWSLSECGYKQTDYCLITVSQFSFLMVDLTTKEAFEVAYASF